MLPYYVWEYNKMNGDDGCGYSSGSLLVDSQPMSVGLVWVLADTWRLVCIYRMNYGIPLW